MNNKIYTVKFNKAVIHADSLYEAKEIALGLIDRTCPHVATIIVIDEEGNQSTYAKFDASHATA